MRGVKLNSSQETCNYLSNQKSIFEQYLGYELSESDLSNLLKSGYRHFGQYYFRPRCFSCGACIPMRIHTQGYPFSRGDRRILNKGKTLQFILEKGAPSFDKYKLYLAHKKKFTSFESAESYENYVETFYTSTLFAKELEIKKDNETLAMMHLDYTQDLISAVYCYYSMEHPKLSLGRLAILTLIQEAIKRDVQHLYLGYYIQSNRHMSYKARYKNTEVLVNDFHWIDFQSVDKEKLRFHPRHSLMVT